MSEFSLIDRYFAAATATRDDVVVGIGDDGAVVRPAPGHQLVMSTDTLVAGVHFPLDTSADAIGHKSLAVNLSDLAAMGAAPAWALLALTMPSEDSEWLDGFVGGFTRLAQQFDLALIGGDTTRGPLTITIQVIGMVPAGKVLTRSGAAPGDGVFVTGSLGDAALALHILKRDTAPPAGDATQLLGALRGHLDYPLPRVQAGLELRGLATSAIDVSDGLLADLGHLLTASGVGARLVREKIPRTEGFNALLRLSGVTADNGWQLAVGGGDDYELCFTIPASKMEAALNQDWGFCGGITQIGTVTAGSGIELVDEAGETLPLPVSGAAGGYDHFA